MQTQNEAMDKVVLRFNNGNIVRGYMLAFDEETATIEIEERGMKGIKKHSLNVLKAVFFVKTFEGNHTYKERKLFSPAPNRGKKILVRFKDKETLIGYLDKDMPQIMGFHLSKSTVKTGFFMWPVDDDSNNIKFYVVKNFVDDIMPVG